MSDKNFKVIRKSLHNVVKQIMPTVLTMELVTEIRKQLGKQMADSLAALTGNIQGRLDTMEERQKTMYESFIRNVLAAPAQNVPPEIAKEADTATNA